LKSSIDRLPYGGQQATGIWFDEQATGIWFDEETYRRAVLRRGKSTWGRGPSFFEWREPVHDMGY
jgi:hypothetical protein